MRKSLSFYIKSTYFKRVQVSAFFLVPHYLVSTLAYGYVLNYCYFLSNNKAYSMLPINFNDNVRISLYYLHFIYLVDATLDINITHSAVRCFESFPHFARHSSNSLDEARQLLLLRRHIVSYRWIMVNHKDALLLSSQTDCASKLSLRLRSTSLRQRMSQHVLWANNVCILRCRIWSLAVLLSISYRANYSL